MKKTITVLGILFLVAAFASPVLSQNFGMGMGGGQPMMGNGGMMGQGYMQDYRGNGNSPYYDTKGQDQINSKFYRDTADLRNAIRNRSAELDVLLNSADPDIEKARALQREINDLRAELDRKRLNYTLESNRNSPDTRSRRNYGNGYNGNMGTGGGC